ncbi:TIGR03016 family PEP-CTERM system-associated outer membrane protein [Rhodovibrio sodomensis]|uniref:TIGR03016 family PEP-CTERM system-associated outer membrane protein n=2 Tax=Rhodovibrio sodomensis TaxID=1088 RepID=A0ABS1DJH5_9PROT|nr:TIGR03016 family PEP-CTERM system-associated outer membrane protein [Rhodovibrio sodomensis]
MPFKRGYDWTADAPAGKPSGYHIPVSARFSAVVAAAAFLVVTATAAPLAASDASAESDAAAVEPMYEIGPGDTIQITVYREAELSGTYPVRPDGRLSLPLVGTVEVVGRTPMQLADVLEDKFSVYLRDPRVDVMVTTATGTFQDRVRVIGSAVSPRSVPYRAGMSALDVLTRIGGLSKYAAGDDAYILRRTDAETRRIPLNLDALASGDNLSANARIKPGDVLVIPEGFLSGDVRFTQSAFFRQTYTDNVDQAPDETKEEALITEVGPQASLSADLTRVQGALNTSLTFERQSLNRQGDDIDVRLNGTGQVEWLESFFFTDVGAAIAQENLGSGQATSASGAGNSNQRTVQTYRVSPYVQQQLGRIASLQLRYSANATVISEDDADRGTDDARFGQARSNNRASDSLQQVATVQMSSGPSFGRYSWTLTGRASEQQFDDGNETVTAGAAGTGSDDVSRRSVTLDNQYDLFRGVALLGTVGYETLESGDPRDDFESPVWNIGLRYQPSPGTQLSARAGRRAEQESFSLEARQEIGARTTLTASFDQQIATGQERRTQNLTAADIDDIRGGGSIESDEFALRDQVTRTETFRIGADTRFGRSNIGLNASYRTEQQDVIDGDDTEETYRVGLNFNRPLTRDLNLSMNASYANSTFSGEAVEATGQSATVEDDEYRASVGLDYQAFQNISLGVRYSFAKRISTRPEDDFTENAVTLSGRLSF